MFKRTLALHQFLREATQRPPIDTDRLPALIDKFRCLLLRRPAHTICRSIPLHIKLALAEVDQFDLPICAHHHILGLQVALDDPIGVQLAECRGHLRGLEPDPRLVESVLAVREHLAALTEVEHEAEPVAHQEALVQGDDEGVAHGGHHPAFVDRADDLGLFVDRQEVQDFHGLDVLGFAVLYELDPALGTLANTF